MDVLFYITIGAIIAVLVVVLILLSLKGRIGTYPVSPAKLRLSLSKEIQLRGFSCSEAKPGVLSVRKDSLVKVKIHFKSIEGGTKVLCEMDTTELGWALIFILIFAPYFGWASIIVALYIHFSGRAFSREFIRNLIPLILEETRPSRESIRETLLQTIAEGERLVNETREQELLAIWSIEALVGLGVLSLWSLLFFVPHLYYGYPFIHSIILATAVALLVLAPGLYFSTRKGRERTAELDDWKSLLATRREMELTGRQPEEESTFDLVMRVSGMSRTWLARLKKLKLWNHPVAGTEIFLWFWGAIIFQGIGLLGPDLPWPLALFLVVLGTLFLFAGLYRAVRWRAKVISDFERDKRLWEERMDGLSESMQDYLGKL